MMQTNLDAIRQIKELRMQGKTTGQICAALNMTKSQVCSYAARHDIPRKLRDSRAIISRRLGRFNLGATLTHEELMTLDRLAAKWGCDTLSEAALEILKDALAEAGE
jgi:hypothetical protein